MIKLVYCIRKRRGMSHEEFCAYWKDVHGPIGARIPGIRRLVQCHALPEGARIRQPDFDGVAELWFDDLPALDRARHSGAWHDSTRDEANFVSSNDSAIVIGVEHPIQLA